MQTGATPFNRSNCNFSVTEIFCNGMTHTNTHNHSSTVHTHTPVSWKTNRCWEENTTVGDTEWRQPNAAWITAIWFSMNSSLASQTGGREEGKEGRKRGAELGETLFFLSLCCYNVLLAQLKRSIYVRCITFKLQSSSHFLLLKSEPLKGTRQAVRFAHAR